MFTFLPAFERHDAGYTLATDAFVIATRIAATDADLTTAAAIVVEGRHLLKVNK